MPPSTPATHFEQGEQLLAEGQLDLAAQAFRKAVQQQPEFAKAYFLLGVTLEQLGRPVRAEQALAAAIQLKSDYVEPYLGLARIYQRTGHLAKAESVVSEACRMAPDRPETFSRQGTILRLQGQYDRALEAFDKALALDPELAAALHDKGTTLQLLGHLKAAVACYRKAIELIPDFLSAYTNLGSTFQQLGQTRSAAGAFKRAQAIDPSYLPARVGGMVNQLKLIYTDEQDLLQARAAYETDLMALSSALDNESGALRGGREAVGMLQPFLLAYQGRNDRHLQAAYAAVMKRMLEPEAPATGDEPKVVGGARFRVGIVSGFFRNHSNWKMPIRGWVENLDRSRFRLFGYHTSGLIDDQTHLAAGEFERFVQGPLTLRQWCSAIHQDNLDILIFPEFGMDPMTLQLGCMRHAPVQATSWGHPTTSGLADIDYFLSSELMEPQEAHAHYTEELVELPNLSVCLQLVTHDDTESDRNALGLPPDKTLIFCCQSLFKYLPEFDVVFPEIALGSPNVQFVFIALPQAVATQAFQERLRRAFAELGLDDKEHCRFLPRLKPAQFAGLMVHVDLVLDSVGWSGCNSTLEAVEAGVPVITLPGNTMRSRHTSAMLQMMGLDELVVPSLKAYVDLAVKLAGNRELRDALRQKILSRRNRLYGDLDCVRALETFLVSAVARKTDRAVHQARLHLLDARASLRQSDSEQARHLVESAVVACAGQPALSYAIGTTWQSLAAYDEAVTAYRSALEQLNPVYRQSIRPEAVEIEPDVPPVPKTQIKVGDFKYPAILPVPDGSGRPFWSVVIPTCNRKQYLLECLASVLAIWPGHEHMEILVIDNGSKPGLAELVAAVGGGIVRYLRHPETIPLQDNWNSAVAATQGRWVHLLHDDDYVLPGFYQTLRVGISSCSQEPGGAFCGYENINEHGDIVLRRRPYGPRRGIAEDWLEIIGLGNVLNPPSMVISRAAYERVGGYSNEILYTTDWELYKRVATFYPWWSEPDYLVHYRQHPLNITHAQNNAGAQGQSIRRSIEMSESYLPRDRVEEITRKARRNYFAWCVEHIKVPLRAGNPDGAMKLMVEALKIDQSDDLVTLLFETISTEEDDQFRQQIFAAAGKVSGFDSADVLFREATRPANNMVRQQLIDRLLEQGPNPDNDGIPTST